MSLEKNLFYTVSKLKSILNKFDVNFRVLTICVPFRENLDLEHEISKF